VEEMMAMASSALGSEARDECPDCMTTPTSSHSTQGQGEALSCQEAEK